MCVCVCGGGTGILDKCKFCKWNLLSVNNKKLKTGLVLIFDGVVSCCSYRPGGVALLQHNQA